MPSKSEYMGDDLHNLAWEFVTAKDLNPKYTYRCSNLARVINDY